MLPAEAAWRISGAMAYAPECVEVEFYEVRQEFIADSSAPALV
jgi:hypothetical protein